MIQFTFEINNFPDSISQYDVRRKKMLNLLLQETFIEEISKYDSIHQYNIIKMDNFRLN